MTPARQVAVWLHGLDSVPAEVLADAKLRLLDTLAVASAAVTLPIGHAIRRGGAALGNGDQSAIIGGGRNTAAITAMVNGTLAHALDFDDTHAASVMHPSAPAVAVALAMAEKCGASGRKLLHGVAAGIELNCRLGLVVPGSFHDAGQHPTGTLGTLSAAMVAAWFLGLDPDGIVAAVGIAGSQASGILEAYADGTWSKTLHPGWAAHAGVVAAQLAAAGFTGPETVLDGRYGVFRAFLPNRSEFDFGQLTDQLGAHWHTLHSAFKLYPCAHSIHAFIEAALVMDAAPEDIDGVMLDVPAAFAGQIAEPRAAKLAPRTTTHARASLYYAVAAALTDRNVGMQHYTDAAIHRADLLTLAARMQHRVVDAPGPIRFSGALTVRTTDGRVLHQEVSDAQGTGPRRLSRADVERKARTVGKPGEMDRIITVLDAIERSDDIASVIPR